MPVTVHSCKIVMALVTAALVCSLSSQARAQASPSDFTSAVRYDLARRVVGTIAPDPDGSGPIHYAATRNKYDIDGRLIRVDKGELSSWQSEDVLPENWPGSVFTIFQTVDTTYDLMDRKVTETLSANGVAYSLTQYSYDPVGRLECTAVRMNPSAYGSLPSSACALGAEGSQGPDRITRQVYDPAGQVTQLEKAYATPLQQNYASYSYSANGKVITLADANGNLSSMTYDGLDRQVQWNFPNPAAAGSVSSTDYEAYSYDTNGNRTSLRKRDGQTIGYGYDALNRLSVKDVPGGTALDVYYGYDPRGLQVYARFGSASGLGVTSSYDGFGRLLSTSNHPDGNTRTLGFQYDADGNRTQVMHPDGTYFVYSYDGLDRSTTIAENGATQVVAWTYDSQGRPSGNARGAVGTSFGYDGVSRLSSLSHDLAGTSTDVSWSLGYNPASQIVSQSRSNAAYAFNGYAAANTSYAVNALNQYTGVGAGTLGYDPNGNLATTGGTTYAYDVENRLISATGTANATLEYDPAGRLWRMASAGSTVTFLYDGDQLLEERDGSGMLLRRYVDGPGEDDPLLWYEGTGLGDRRSLQVDRQGSIVSVANADGSLRTIDTYDEYGVPGVSNDGRFQYTGQTWLPALGLYYYKARMYSSRLGRFLQTDPIGYKDQNNLYAYVANDPVNHNDPSGNQIAEAQLAQQDLQRRVARGETAEHASKQMAKEGVVGVVAGLAVAVAVEVALPAAAAGAEGAPAAAPAVTEIAGSTGARATGQVITEIPKPVTGVARTIQPDKVPAAARAAEMSRAAIARGNSVEGMARKTTGAGWGDLGKTAWDVLKIVFGIH